MSILVDKQALSDKEFTISFVLIDTKEQHTLQIKNGSVLLYENAFSQATKIEGDTQLLQLFTENMNQFTLGNYFPFNIVEP